MSSWLTIVGLGEDGLAGLPAASLRAIEEAEIIIGPPRHLELIGSTMAEQRAWPVPFRDGVPMVLDCRERKTVVLASGDPFWFGAGRVLAEVLEPDEWRALPGVSVFSLAAARLGWPLEHVRCRGLHAAPLSRLRPDLSVGQRVIVTLRDGDAVGELAAYLCQAGFGESQLHILEALGGGREKVTNTVADAFANDAPARQVTTPIAAAIEVAGTGPALPLASGRRDAFFEHDGQITKQPMRALTLSALAPKHGETLWDIGAGSGSIALEWLLADASLQAVAIEARPDRAVRIAANATALGQDRLQVVTATAPEGLEGLPAPDAVFVGGGLSEALLSELERRLAPGTRLVANAVTLETEALVIKAQARLGGSLLKIALSEPEPLGRYHGWKAAYPVVQWSVTL